MKRKTNVPNVLNIECRLDNHFSYYVDANGLLKGEWGGFEELNEKGPNGEKMYSLYYNRFSQDVEINEFGLFYNKFSCKKYDAVLKLNKYFYLCEKNNRLGLIDNYGDTVLHVAYNDITPCFEREYVFIVTTETGKFLTNFSSAMTSEVYDDIFIVFNSVIYNENNKYGFLNIHGQVLTKPIFIAHRFNTGSLIYEFQGLYFDVFIKDDLLYGRIPLYEYDNCFRVGSDSINCFYITEKKGKYGLLSSMTRCISEPVLDEILLYNPKNKWSKGMYKTYFLDNKTGKSIEAIFIMARIGEKYILFNAETGKCIIDNCESMRYKSAYRDSDNDYIEYSKNGKIGYVSYGGIVISPEEYEDIYIGFDFFYVEKNGKKGVLHPSGVELFPCVYDSIRGDIFGEFHLIRDGKEEHVRTENHSSQFYYERPTYGKYADSYVQSEMGWSDDDIDTVLDGDPDAYWNID